MNRPFNIPITLPRGPEHLWKVIREAGHAGITIPELAGCTNGVAFSTVKNYVHDWRDAGVLVPIGTVPARSHRSVDPVRYAAKEGVRDAPVVRREDYTGTRGEIQHDLWNAMRTLNEGFSLPELALAASTAEREIKVRTAESYVRDLAKAGLVAVLTPYSKGAKGRRGGAQAGRYRLKPSANTGPRPLKVFASRFVFDPNRNRLVGSTATEEAQS